MILLLVILVHDVCSLNVAFTANVGVTPEAEGVMRMVIEEGADALVITGGLGMDAPASEFLSQLDSTLGSTLPVLLVPGDEDVVEWPAYQAWMDARSNRFGCEGNGLNLRCTVGDMETGAVVYTSGAPYIGDNDKAVELMETLSEEVYLTRFCAWHGHNAAMQTGDSPDTVGMMRYAACQAHGALIVTGDDHAYARTVTLKGWREPVDSVDVGPHDVYLARSFSAITVVGLGGHSISPVRDSYVTEEFWATVYASNHYKKSGVEQLGEADMYGALFIEDRKDLKAGRGRFIVRTPMTAAMDFHIIDDFSIYNDNSVAAGEFFYHNELDDSTTKAAVYFVGVSSIALFFGATCALCAWANPFV